MKVVIGGYMRRAIGERVTPPWMTDAHGAQHRNLAYVVLAEADEDYGMKGLLRFVTKTDASGAPLSVTLVEYDEMTDAIINRFEIPEEAEAAAPVVVEFPLSSPKPGVTQAKPAPKPLAGKVKEQQDDVE